MEKKQKIKFKNNRQHLNYCIYSSNQRLLLFVY